MKRKYLTLTTILLIFTLVLGGNGIFALRMAANSSGDIVGGASDDIAGGASVFVFRGSRKKPHNRNAFRKAAFARTKQAKAETRRKRINQSATLGGRRPGTTTAKPGTPEKEAELLAVAGQKLLEQKNYDAAETKFMQARRLYPDNERAKIGLGAIFMERGDKAFAANDFKTAASLYERAVGFDANNADAYASLGESYDALDMKDKAALAYENALRLNPKLSSLGASLASMFFEAENFTKAQIYIDQALIATPGDPELQNRYGIVMLRLGKTNEAIAAFQNAAQLNPAYAEAYNNLGEAYDLLGRTAEAEAAFREAIKQNPNFAEAHYNLGVMAYNREQYSQAAEHYQKAMELKPDFVEARNNMADTYRQMEKFPEAVAVYKTIVPYTPNDPELYHKYGYCEGKAKNWDESAKLLEKTADLEQGKNADDYSNVAWAYNSAGRTEKKNNNEGRARENFAKGKENAQKAADKDPNSPAAKFNLGDALTALGEAALAATVLRAALSLKPQWAEAHNNLGLALFMAGDLNNASNELRAATNINNNFVAAFANLALVETKRGNKKEAMKARARVAQLNPNMAKDLDNFIAQKLINFGTRKIESEIRNKIPRLPF